MKNLRTWKNLIFLSNKKIALVVFNTLNNKNNILFANEVSVDEENIQAKLSNLLTNAANFLGSNIKAASLIFEDFNIELNQINKVFANCSSKEEIIKEIYSDARCDGKFVNSVIFNEPIDLSKPVVAQTLVSKYANYDKFRKMLAYCNVKLQSCANIATLLNDNKDEIVVSIAKGQSFACHYSNNNLVKCTNINVNCDMIVKSLAEQFNTSEANVQKQAKIANILVKNDDYNFDLSWNYDLKNRSMSYINAVDFVSFWRKQLVSQIKTNLDINNLNGIKVIANNELNNFNSTKINAKTLGLDSLSETLISAFNNVNRLADVESQGKYESQYETEYERVLA